MFKILLVFLPIFLFTSELKQKHILLLNSYNQSMTWVQDITTSVYDVLEPDKNNYVIHIENMDTKRIYTEEYLEQLKNTYIDKYSDIEIDLILSSDNNALDFLKSNRNEIFGNVPVSFSGINFFKDSDLIGYSNYTGITEEFDTLGTIETALKLKPNTEEIFVINDYLKSGIAAKKAIKEELKEFDKSIKITYSKNTTVSELKRKLNSLSKNTIVLLGVYFKDKDGKYFTYEKMGELLSTYSKAPVFCLFEFNLNNGVVGGSVISGYYQGKKMSELAKKILSGTSISKIPIQKKGSTKIIYDYTELKKYKFDLKKLPTNALILNKPSTQIPFDKKEKRYLKEKKQINMCIDPSWMPYEAFDKKGQHIGMTYDYFKVFEKKIGININVVKTNSWSESLLFVKNRKCDILSLAMETKERKEYVNFTTAYFTAPLVLATKTNISFISDIEHLDNKKIGIVKDYATNSLIRVNYPNIKIIDVENTKNGLQLVSNGQIFGFIGSVPDISYISQKHFIGELKITAKLKEEQSLGIAIRNDEDLLFNIFEKSIYNISENTKQNILNKHISIKYDQGINYKLLAQVLFVLLVIILGILYRHYLLTKAKNKLSELVEKKTKELKKLNKTLENKVEKRTKKIQDLLDNAGQGFLSFNKNFLIDREYSLECEYLLEKDLYDKDIAYLLFKDKVKRIEFFKETIIDALNEKNDLTTFLLLTLLPKELVLNKRAILIEYKIISDNNIMMILTNVTDKKKLEKKLKKEEYILKMIVSIVSDNIYFFDTKQSYEDFCRDVILYINPHNSLEDNANTINALVHTFKGLFSQLYMNNTVSQLNNIESKITYFINEHKTNNELREYLITPILLSCMNNDLKVISDTLGDNFLAHHDFIKVDEEILIKLEQKVSLLSISNPEQKEDCTAIINDIKQIKSKSLYYYLSIYPKVCQQICLSLNKDIQAFSIRGDKKIIVSDKFKPFINSLIHIFRNCCDHGIESKEIRALSHKPEIGIIECKFNTLRDNLIIEISDDGKGIDTNLLKMKILEYNLLAIEELDNLSKDEIINFIFNSNFSTNEILSTISGRGIGLNAVKLELIKLKGTVKVKTEDNQGSSFIFTIPLYQ